jgi:hypothetical protein
MFPRHNIHRLNWTSLEGKTHNQSDHILQTGDGIQVYLMSETGSNCAAQKFNIERFNLKEQNVAEGKDVKFQRGLQPKRS